MNGKINYVIKPEHDIFLINPQNGLIYPKNVYNFTENITISLNIKVNDQDENIYSRRFVQVLLLYYKR